MTYEEIIDVESAKERFMGNYGLFSKYLFQFPERSLFGDLEAQYRAGGAAAAFETAHTMKGIVGNLSLQSVETPLVVVVEVLRKGELPSEAEWKALDAAYHTAVETIGKLKAEGTPLF